jgi:signal transduction histidine kinase
VRIEIADTGPGIPADVLPHLFEPFVSSHPEGAGLGLSISYGIIEAHHGHITVESDADKGTRFAIWLPARDN